MEHNELRVYYSSTFFNSGDLQKFAIQYLAKLPTEVTCLLSRGSSGCAIASAMLAHAVYPLNHCHFRKEHDNAHYEDYAGDYHKSNICAIVDDLIETGETLKKMMDDAKERDISVKYVLVGHIHNDDRNTEIVNKCREFGIQIIEVENDENGNRIKEGGYCK